MFSLSCTKERKKEVPFSMAVGNSELIHECFSKHSRIGTARMKKDNETDEDGKKGVWKKYRGHERKKSRQPISTLSKYNINKHKRYQI